MTLSSDKPCWEIMECENFAHCPAKKNLEKTCWDIVSELEDYRKAFKICQKCIVYKLKVENSALTSEEIQALKGKKDRCVLDLPPKK